MKKVYSGERKNSGNVVTVAECDDSYNVLSENELNPRLDCVNHSPDGFEWGYSGSGPSQLAFAILADLINPKFAKKHYQEFKIRAIATLDRNKDFTLIEDDIRTMYEKYLQEAV